MVSRKSKSEKVRSPKDGAAHKTSSAKRRVFRWVAALGVPIVVLLGVELALRLIGYGYPTHFFVPSETGSPDLYRENPKFGWRFFPQRLARAPDPVLLSRAKPPDTVRVFVFGESAALGDPVPAYGFSRILRELLEARCPGTKFEVVNVSMTAINSHVILPIARDCVPFKADLWIIYMGNNEVIGPFGAGSVFGSRAPPMSLLRLSLGVKRTCLGQILDALWQKAPVRRHAFQEWEGLKMMLDEQFRREDPALQRVYRHFRRNLEDILSMAIDAGARPIVCSVSSNLKDCSPFASLHRTDLSAADRAEWERLVASAMELESRKSFAQALLEYRRASELDPTHAAVAFRIARCELASGEITKAREHYILARDLDALRFRADTEINRIIREVCHHHTAKGATFVDTEALIVNATPSGVPGEECFWDHVHFNFAGNYRLARGLMDSVFAQLPDPVRQASLQGRVLTEAECAERLAYTEWDQRAVLEEMWRRVQEPPFTDQIDHEVLLQRWSRLLAELDRKLSPLELARAVQTYRQALERRSDDWILRHRLAFLLEAAGDLAEAEQQWRRVVEIVPNFVDALFKLGDMSAARSSLVEAGTFYRRVLDGRPDSFEAMNGLGLVRMEEGEFEEATRLFQRALQIQPKFTAAHINLGLAASRRGRLAEAEAHYRDAIAADPRSGAAQINLGNLLARQQRYAEAVAAYRQAIQLKPGEATIHLGLADALEATGHSSKAAEHYRMAIELNSGLVQAHFNLGVLLANSGDLVAATRCFEEAVRLSPDDPQAHLNLAVALAKQNRLPEAVAEFQTVLRLDPANPAARHYLDVATARERSQP
jgi:tetratricopeptide (TPR) repeat protein